MHVEIIREGSSQVETCFFLKGLRHVIIIMFEAFMQLREGVKNILRGGVPRFYWGYRPYPLIKGGDQTIFFIFTGGRE